MNIYFGGDSMVAGAELEHPETQGFAAQLSNKLGAQKFVVDAEDGSSNSLILRKMALYLHDCSKTRSYPDFVVIGWSENWREDWFENGYRSVSGTGPKFSTDRTRDFDYWKKHIVEFKHMHEISKFYNRAIHNLHLELQYLKIPHVFFNAIQILNFMTNYNPRLILQHGDILRLDWHNCYLNPYDHPNMCWRGWAVERNYEQVTEGLYHFREDCHADWAQVIYDYIKEKNLV